MKACISAGVKLFFPSEFALVRSLDPFVYSQLKHHRAGIGTRYGIVRVEDQEAGYCESSKPWTSYSADFQRVVSSLVYDKYVSRNLYL